MEMATTLVNSKYGDCSIVGLNPFCKLNPAPEVIFLTSFSSVLKYLHEFQQVIFPQAKSDFWKAKYDHEAAKKARAAAIAAKKTVRKSKKKPTASDLFKLDDSSE